MLYNMIKASTTPLAVCLGIENKLFGSRRNNNEDKHEEAVSILSCLFSAGDRNYWFLFDAMLMQQRYRFFRTSP